MASRMRRDSSLETRTARLKKPPRGKPYAGPSLGRGVRQDYRRNKTGNGSWIARGANGHGGYWTKVIAEADDLDDSNGRSILNYHEAQDAIRKLTRGDDGGSEAAPLSVDAALKAFRSDLEARQANPYNSDWVRVHLTSALLAKPVAVLSSHELQTWRDSLLATLAPSTVNRLCGCLSAALELAAQHDPKRIQNKRAWDIGLAPLPDATEARNIVLPDATVRAFVAEAYALDDKLGLLIDVLAVTGTRPSQAVRLRVADLHDHPTKPKLAMPKSAKGGGKNRAKKRVERFSVPITTTLAARLRQAAKGRPEDAPLLLQADGAPWGDNPGQRYHRWVDRVVKSIGLDPAIVSVYALRHSSIVRRLLSHMPVALVASLHNTSPKVIQRHYARFITEHADDHARIGLLQEEPPSGENVVAMAS
ncbi:integrase [Bradyrhizobium sp. CCBAU 11434]|uniref:site-specific integrase n=1 Tax=Bradyrhizobium sp. CCBAU 11434 TaxID=1630885 RepID=UPI002306BE38|nr:site-specific integrase [Bradyrhizobium sp. CCBAU 11434]MDA9521463.1 integrase [Bradyrhizobium sp. CCBAU 11434]